MFRVEIKFAQGFDLAHEFSEDFAALDDENIGKAVLFFKTKMDTFNMRGIAFIIFPDGPEYEMTFNLISPEKQCTLGDIAVPATLYRARKLTEGFHQRLTNLKLEHAS